MDISEAIEAIKFAELHTLYRTMTQNGWESITDVKQDPWVIQHLHQFKCSTRSEVKKKHNDLAIKLGHVDQLFE